MLRKLSTVSISRWVPPILALALLFALSTSVQAQATQGVVRTFMAVLDKSSVSPDWDPGYMDDNSLMLVVHGRYEPGVSVSRAFVEGSVSPLGFPLDEFRWYLGVGTEVKHVTKQGVEGYAEVYWWDDDEDPFAHNFPPVGSRCMTGDPDNGGQIVFYDVFYVMEVDAGNLAVTDEYWRTDYIVAIGVGAFTK